MDEWIITITKVPGGFLIRKKYVEGNKPEQSYKVPLPVSVGGTLFQLLLD